MIKGIHCYYSAYPDSMIHIRLLHIAISLLCIHEVVDIVFIWILHLKLVIHDLVSEFKIQISRDILGRIMYKYFIQNNWT